MSEEPPLVPVAIVGSGPAGLTAALYAARAELTPVVIAGVPAGGQLLITSEVENFPGFPDGIQGPELIDRMRRQATRFGATFVDDNVTRVDLSHRPFTIETGSHGRYRARAVIVATGANARWLGLASEQKLVGHGVSACATCDGFFFKGVDLAVVGGGDSAMEEALFLTNFARSVTIVHRRGEFRASRIMQERVRRHPKIRVRFHTEVTEVVGSDKVEALKLRDARTGASSDLKVGGLFVAIGHDPATEVFRGVLELDELGYVKLHEGTRTSVEGVFAAGDVHDRRYRQAVSAAGDGCRAAIDAERWLAEQEGENVAHAATQPLNTVPPDGT